MNVQRLVIRIIGLLVCGSAFVSAPLQAKYIFTYDLCIQYFEGRNVKEARAELVKRHEFTSAEWQAIDTHSIFVGESVDAVFCTFGRPDTVNRNVYSGGETDQYVFDSNSLFVYGDQNGKVLSYQQNQ